MTHQFSTKRESHSLRIRKNYGRKIIDFLCRRAGAICTTALQKHKQQSETEKSEQLRPDNEASKANRKKTPTENSQQDLPPAITDVPKSVGVVSQPETRKDEQNPQDKTKSICERAFGPETWSQWFMAGLASLASVFAYKTFWQLAGKPMLL